MYKTLIDEYFNKNKDSMLKDICNKTDKQHTDY